MGIPSYFSYLIRHHTNIICNAAFFMKNHIRFNRLYMDCNSILYDSYRSISQSLSIEEFQTALLDKTAKQIEHYIEQINPSDYIFIAFDGVAPMAKMEQQRNRRYKSWFESSILNTIEPPDVPVDVEKTTCMFTPGTQFMQRLSDYIRVRFEKKETRYRVKSIIVTTSDEPGEGEHKLYNHLRTYPCSDDEYSVVYGLDADLLMLSLFHLRYCPHLYVFREAPQFASIDTVKNCGPEEPIFLDIGKLGRSISHEMRCSAPDNHRMMDYVFLCFFLGNDFLPHFPNLNIRTHGITHLLDIYREVIGNKAEQFLLSKTNPPTIQWKTLSRFITALAKHEHPWIREEYAIRSKWNKKPVSLQPKKSVKERMELFWNTPVLYRQEELFINPYENEWQQRYYNRLFPSDTTIQDVCMNYLEGLEWVYQYYLLGKIDWSWKYRYHYPPLLEHLALKTPHYNTQFLSNLNTKPVHPYTQLSYVLPPIYHFLLPPYLAKKLRTLYSAYYVGKPNQDNIPQLEFQWSFCRYFWESHVYLPIMPLTVLQDIEKEAAKL